MLSGSSQAAIELLSLTRKQKGRSRREERGRKRDEIERRWTDIDTDRFWKKRKRKLKRERESV